MRKKEKSKLPECKWHQMGGSSIKSYA